MTGKRHIITQERFKLSTDREINGLKINCKWHKPMKNNLKKKLNVNAKQWKKNPRQNKQKAEIEHR